MGEKGGPDDYSGENLKNSINSKIILTAIISVLIGAAFILIFIFTGMQISHKYDQSQKPATANNKTPEVEQVIELEYDSYEYGYTADSEYSATEHYRNLVFELLDAKSDYILIDNTDKLAEVLDVIALVNDNRVMERPQGLDEEFFMSGSVIAVGVQDRGLSSSDISGVHRDANYNIFITLNKVAASDTINYIGKVYLIKLPNIKPKSITVSTNDGI